MEKLNMKRRWLLIGLLLIEAMIMFWIVPKANADEIEMPITLVIGTLLALMISLAVLIKWNQDNRKAVIPVFVICVTTYLQILYCSVFYKWGASVCMDLHIRSEERRVGQTCRYRW